MLTRIRPLMTHLSDRAQELGAQYIVASHHPWVIDQLAAYRGTLLERPAGGASRAVAVALPAEAMRAGVLVSDWLVERERDDGA